MPDGTIMDGPTHGEGQECIEWDDGYKKGGKIKNPRYNGKGKVTAKQLSAGGMLVGPSHDDGGIQALVDGTEPIEVEGGEFIINKQTVDAVGEDFLHKLNSTQTSHHTGGFGEGQLPQPSQYKDGGKVTRRNNMARGRRAPRRGTAPARRMARGGRATVRRKTAPRRATGTPRRRMAAGGRACGGPGQMPCGRKMARGGRTRPIPSRGRKMARGGGINRLAPYPTSRSIPGGHNALNMKCQSYTSQIDCQAAMGCSWNFSTSMCH